VPRKDEYKRTRVKTGASIGANATIVCGSTLGRYCFIGAGAVVTHDVPDYALCYGNPARLRGWVCSCGEKLDTEPAEEAVETIECQYCGLLYRRDGPNMEQIDCKENQ
jgi:UDP-2-acetamido-3-amino-2,3-dideoxy-glucuronate N-acetyltransferase